MHGNILKIDFIWGPVFHWHENEALNRKLFYYAFEWLVFAWNHLETRNCDWGSVSKLTGKQEGGADNKIGGGTYW